MRIKVETQRGTRWKSRWRPKEGQGGNQGGHPKRDKVEIKVDTQRGTRWKSRWTPRGIPSKDEVPDVEEMYVDVEEMYVDTQRGKPSKDTQVWE